MKVILRNHVGVTKAVKVGFSWTTLFFGFFVPLLRGDLKWAIIVGILSIALGVFTFGIGGWIPGFVFCFVYNKIYIKELLEKGYMPESREDESLLRSKGIIA